MVTMAPLRSPTDLEAAYLASLNSALATPTINPILIRNELQDILQLIRLPWVTDFLFTTEMTSLSALTAPLNMRSAVTSTVQMTAIQCNATSFDSRPFDVNLTGSFIFVPSFSVGHISVGFGVQECFANCFTDWCISPADFQTWNTNHFRYVRDDKQGILLMLFRDRRTGCFKMDSMKHITATSRRRVFCIFDQEALEKAVHTDQGILPTEAVLKALNMINFLTETRQCSECTIKARAQCTCQVDLTPPAHPLDFSPLQKNMSSFLGCYEGLAKSSVLKMGSELFSANVGSRIEIVGGVDEDLLTRLSRWAISDQLKDRKEDPLALAMPDAGIGQQNVLFPNTMGMGMGSTQMEQTPLAIDTALFGAPINTSSCSSGSAADASQDGKEHTGVLTVDRLEDARSCQEAHGCGGELRNGFAGYTNNGNSWTGIGDEAMILVDSITGEKDADDMCDIDTMEGESSESHTNSEPRANCEPTVITAPTVWEGDVGNAGRARALSIAPAVVIDATAMRKQDEKELRAELRKQRNREAAQRSNARRKLKNDSLKKALKEEHAKAAELRARELSLREENLRLRKLTSS